VSLDEEVWQVRPLSLGQSEAAGPQDCYKFSFRLSKTTLYLLVRPPSPLFFGNTSGGQWAQHLEKVWWPYICMPVHQYYLKNRLTVTLCSTGKVVDELEEL
jgi:hypothetical protein